MSPALVVHHFGSKDGLRAAVDARVAEVFDAMFAAGGEEPELFANEAAPSLAELMLRHLPPDSPIPAYLRHVLLYGGEVGHALFARWYRATRALLESMAGGGIARPSADPPARAAFLMINDLALLLLREHLTDVLDAYQHGVFHHREDE